MKDNLEKAFKNSLEEYEVPYDPKAWDAVNAELDAKASGGNPVLSNVLKWGLATALLGIVVTASYFLWYNNPTETEKSATTAIERKQQESAPTTQKTESSEAKEITTKNNESLSTESPQESADNSVHLAKEEKVDYPISNSENTSSNNSEQSGKIMPTETKDTPTTKKETPKVDKHSI